MASLAAARQQQVVVRLVDRVGLLGWRRDAQPSQPGRYCEGLVLLALVPYCLVIYLVMYVFYLCFIFLFCIGVVATK